MIKCYPSFKRGAIYLQKATHKSWNHYFVIFCEVLQFEVAVPRLCTFYMVLHPPTHVQLKIPIVMFTICCVWVPCKFWDQLRTICTWRLKLKILKNKHTHTHTLYVAPLNHGRHKCPVLVCGPVPLVNRLRAHCHIWINQKIPNFVASKLSMWHNITDSNMNKRSDWNNQATIRTNIKGVRTNCSQLDYDRIGH